MVSSFSMQTIATQDSERRDNAVEFAALETARRLGRVNFAKTSGTVNRDRGKKLANSSIPNDEPRSNCGTTFLLQLSSRF